MHRTLAPHAVIDTWLAQLIFFLPQSYTLICTYMNCNRTVVEHALTCADVYWPFDVLHLPLSTYLHFRLSLFTIVLFAHCHCQPFDKHRSVTTAYMNSIFYLSVDSIIHVKRERKQYSWWRWLALRISDREILSFGPYQIDIPPVRSLWLNKHRSLGSASFSWCGEENIAGEVFLNLIKTINIDRLILQSNLFIRVSARFFSLSTCPQADFSFSLFLSVCLSLLSMPLNWTVWLVGPIQWVDRQMRLSWPWTMLLSRVTLLSL